MFAAFAEAIRATVQPCTFLLIVPIVVVVLATGARWRPTAAAVGRHDSVVVALTRWSLD